MIQRLRDVARGKSVAILGSAPSVELYRSLEDLTIAVNGASQLDAKIDYFLSGHQSAHTRTWFPHDMTLILNSMSAVYSKHLYDDAVRETLVDAYEASLQTSGLEDAAGFVYNHLFRGLPPPREPHTFFYFEEPTTSLEDAVHPAQQDLFGGGTSACLSLQTAQIMGAREIHLYGCSFDNHDGDQYLGGNYFYEAKPGERGITNADQRHFMDRVIDIIQMRGLPVYIHGPSKLSKGTFLD
ncbi:hypothetical protein H6504_03985 [Candidatus Woesearchaeota archaeon]|nr:hypothetical protein [Candidatus Woesearchaeota archaeon]